MAMGEPYEYGLLRLAAALASDGLFVDCGAHVGNHSVYLARSGARVVSIEPNPEIREFLECNVRNNSLEDRVRIIPFGLWSTSSTGRVERGEPGNTGSSRIIPIPGEGDVDLVALDDLNLAPDVLKIDVEGLELDVLEGAASTISMHRPAILIEAHDGPSEVTRMLRPFGYRRLGGSFAPAPTFLFVARFEHISHAMPFFLKQTALRLARTPRWIACRTPGLKIFYAWAQSRPWGARQR